MAVFLYGIAPVPLQALLVYTIQVMIAQPNIRHLTQERLPTTFMIKP